MIKLEEIFVLKEEEDVRSESTGSITHGIGEFDPFGTRGDVQFGPAGGGNGTAGPST